MTEIGVKQNDIIIGIYEYDPDFGRFYVKEARGKPRFKAISYKTAKGAIGYIRRQASKYITISEAIQNRFGIGCR